MRALLDRLHFGRPQLYAALLLAVFLVQAAALAVLKPPTRNEAKFYPRASREYWIEGSPIPEVAPILASLPLLIDTEAHPLAARILMRLPFLVMGWLLGGSLWYVTRRLYGDTGGYIALALYAFSPAIRFSSEANPHIGAMFGGFGIVFITIAASHTLYAPARRPLHPNRVLALFDFQHRWRRILLLAFALFLAAGSSWWSLWLVPVALGFMLYLVPGKRLAALVMFGAAMTFAILALAACFRFDFHGMFEDVAGTVRIIPGFFSTYWHIAMPLMLGSMRLVTNVFGQAALLVLILSSLVTYAAWPRTRYFGNTAPFLVFALGWMLTFGGIIFDLMIFGLVPLMAMSFLLVFIAGIYSDLLETRHRRRWLAVLVALLAANAATYLWSSYM